MSRTTTDRSSQQTPTSPDHRETPAAAGPRSAPSCRSTVSQISLHDLAQPPVDDQLGRLGRHARSHACACAVVARYSPRRSALRANSRETVEGERPSRRAIHRTELPAALATAISSRSEKERRERMNQSWPPLLRYGRLDDVSLRTRRGRELAGRHDGQQGRPVAIAAQFGGPPRRAEHSSARRARLSDPPDTARPLAIAPDRRPEAARPTHRPIRVKAEGLAAERIRDDLHG